MRRYLLLFALALTCTPACSVLSDPCASVLPVVTTTQAQLADVQRAINDVEASGIREALPPAQRTTFDAALADLRHGYAIAVQALAIAAESCAAPDLRGALSLIVDAWHVIRSFVSLVGGPDTQTVQIADPVLYTEATEAHGG